MTKYNLFLDDASRKKVEKDMKAYGHMNIAPFVRMLIKHWPFKDGKQWSDDDMMAFAKEYSARKKDEPYILESEEIRLNRELNKFKNDR